MKYLPCEQIARPAPHMCEALSFAEIKLALLQGFLGALALGNVLHGAEQFVRLSRCVSLRIAWRRAPAVGRYAVDRAHFSVRTNDPKFSVGAHSSHKVLVYSSVERLAIFRVDHRLYRGQSIGRSCGLRPKMR